MATRKKTAGTAAPQGGNADELKAMLLAELRRLLAEAHAVMLKAAHTARSAATHEEMKPENDKDTRGIEAGYLAAGQSARALELQRAVQELGTATARSFTAGDVIAPFALVEVEEEVNDSAVRSRIFLCPWGGGLKPASALGEILVVTPQSPLGQAMIGKRVGDVVELRVGPRVRELEVISLA